MVVTVNEEARGEEAISEELATAKAAKVKVTSNSTFIVSILSLPRCKTGRGMSDG